MTNGDPLNKDELIKLFKSGLDKILISVYDGEKEYKEFEQMVKASELAKNQYIIRKRSLL